MGGDKDLAAVEARMFDTVLDVGEHRLAQREVRRRLQVQQAWQHAAVTAGVEDEAGLDVVFATVFAAYMQVAVAGGKIHPDQGLTVTDLYALQRCLIGQQLVEVGALDLEGRGLAVAERVTEIKGAVALAPGKRGTGFQLETGGVDGLEHAGFFDKVDAVGQQALADGKTREVLALDDQYIMPVTLEQRGRNGTGRAGTDHHDLAAFHFNCGHCGSLPGWRSLHSTQKN